MWLTNGATSTLVAVLTKTDEGDESVYKNMTTFLVEKEAGFGETAPGHHRAGQDRQDGLQGRRDDRADPRGPPDRRRAGPRRGARQGLLPDDGRRRGRPRQRRRPRLRAGVARSSSSPSPTPSSARPSARPIAEHQAVLFRLAEMATKVEVAHTMMVKAARLKDTGKRMDVEAGMAKMVASEYANEVVEDVLPHPRRLRLLQGVRDRAPHARGQVHAHRRGHLRHPEDDHRPQSLLKDYQLR